MILELPAVIGMGMIGSGAAEYLDLSQNQTIAFVATAGYLGPRPIFSFLDRWISRKTP